MNTCTLTQSDSYVETLSLQKIDALPGSFELLIQSQLLSAKDPWALRVQHRVLVSAQALEGLGALIDSCLS